MPCKAERSPRLAAPRLSGLTTQNTMHEGSIVTRLGMTYVHIPVDFKAPAAWDFNAFCGVMEEFEQQPVFVHCAANMRVSAFVFLYRILRMGVRRAEAES